MKSFGEENHVRKKPLNCGDVEIKRLFLNVLNRTVMDIKQTKLALSPTMMTAKRKDTYRNQAIAFIRTEWCRDICEFTDIDYISFVNYTQKIIIEASKNAETMSRSSKRE